MESFDLIHLIDRIRVISKNGLWHSDDKYDIERYNELFELSCEYYSNYFDYSYEEIYEMFDAELGYITPKVGALCIISDENNRLFLVKRFDNDLWSIPGGSLYLRESPSQAAVRKMKDETGINASVDKILGVFSQKANESTPHGFVTVAYLCEVENAGANTSQSTENGEYKNYHEIEKWYMNHKEIAQNAIEALE